MLVLLDELAVSPPFFSRSLNASPEEHFLLSLPSIRELLYKAGFHTTHYWRVLEHQIISAAHAVDSDMTNG